MADKIKRTVKNFPIKSRDILALIIVLTFSLLSITNHDMQQFMFPLTTVIAFYFGTSHREDRGDNNGNKS